MLIVEDEIIIVLKIRMVLERMGHSVIAIVETGVQINASYYDPDGIAVLQTPRASGIGGVPGGSRPF